TDLRDSASDLLAKGKETLNRQKETIADAMEAGKRAYHDAVNQPPQPTAEGTRGRHQPDLWAVIVDRGGRGRGAVPGAHCRISPRRWDRRGNRHREIGRASCRERV